MAFEEFKLENRISDETWNQSGCDWATLVDIAVDFDRNHEVLSRSAEFFARVIQTFPGVHSVRWRVKDSSHLLEKIVRKRAAKEKKYLSVSKDNYFSVVTDLIGIRALHLFKDEYLVIDSCIRDKWATVEKPVIYFREGDDRPSPAFARKHKFSVKQHPAGYRSVHYVLASSPLKQPVVAEVQVRTIFEEGWSEIDHKIRYPNFSNDESVKAFLAIFNRLAGSADEMGTFVKGLDSSLKEYSEEGALFQAELNKAQKEKDEAYIKMESIAAELSHANDTGHSYKLKIAQLQTEIARSKTAGKVVVVGGISPAAKMSNNFSAGGILKENPKSDTLVGFLAKNLGLAPGGDFERRLEQEKNRLVGRADVASGKVAVVGHSEQGRKISFGELSGLGIHEEKDKSKS
jgi:ppGpp synthetase/RelA/SpoT-type nucleotidyltranferase